MTDKEKRQKRQSAEDAVFNRLLLCMLGVIIAEAVVLLVKRFYIDVTGNDLSLSIAIGLDHVFSVFNYVGFVLIVLGIVWCVLNARKKINLRLPLICTVVIGCLWIISMLAYHFYVTGMKMLVALPIVAAVLILIYFLYQRAFFVNAILTGCGMAALWCLRQSQGTLVTVAFVIGWIALVVIGILVYLLKKKGGKAGKYQLVSDQKSYGICWVTCAVVLLATLLGFILGAGLAYYLIYVLIGWLFCLAVYFTVKLM